MPPKGDPSRGGLWATLVTIFCLVGAITLVFVALGSDSWFEYDAEFSDNIDVPLLEAEGEGFEMTKVSSVFRYFIYACLVAFIGIAIVLLFLVKIVTWENRPTMTLLVIFITMLLIIAFASVFVVRGGLSRKEVYDVTTTPHTTTTAAPTTTQAGASTQAATTTHKPVVVTYFGDSTRFAFKMPVWCILIAMLLMLVVVTVFDGYIAYVTQMGPNPWVLNACGIQFNSVVTSSGSSKMGNK
jgi:hypothetical protein